jgi:hypothetical protein
MGLIARIFGGVSRQELDGIRLDMSQPFWELSGETDYALLLAALPELLPSDCVLYLEGGSPRGELLEFLTQHAVPERAHVACGTIWPRPKIFHVPATPQTLARLANLMESCAWPELSVHFHVYRDQTVLLEWHDVFDQEMLLSATLPEPSVRAFAAKLGMRLEPSRR